MYVVMYVCVVQNNKDDTPECVLSSTKSPQAIIAHTQTLSLLE